VDHLKSLVALKEQAGSFSDEETIRQALRADPNNAQKHYELGLLLARKGDYERALQELLAAGERDYKLLTSHIREAMVQIFHIIGDQSPLANEYRQRLASLLY
jgi:thioredoxin-like negative regulator of GroEL